MCQPFSAHGQTTVSYTVRFDWKKQLAHDWNNSRSVHSKSPPRRSPNDTSASSSWLASMLQQQTKVASHVVGSGTRPAYQAGPCPIICGESLNQCYPLTLLPPVDDEWLECYRQQRHHTNNRRGEHLSSIIVPRSQQTSCMARVEAEEKRRM